MLQKCGILKGLQNHNIANPSFCRYSPFMGKLLCAVCFLLLLGQSAYAKGASPEKKYILLPNGETYAYIEQGESGESGGDVILLLHGNTSSSLHFLPLFARLKNVRLVAPDMRGLGDSSYNGRISGLDELAGDIKLFADALGIAQAHIVGWSTGGGIALELAAKYPEFARSLFIIEGVSYKGIPVFKSSVGETPLPYSGREDLAATRSMVLMLAALRDKNAYFMNMVWKASIYTVKKPRARDNRMYIAESLKQRNLVDINWALMTFNMSNEHNGYSAGTDVINAIRCPVIFTSAEHDKVIPPSVAYENAAAIRGSKVLVYPKCGHSPMVDLPDRLAKDIMAHIGAR